MVKSPSFGRGFGDEWRELGISLVAMVKSIQEKCRYLKI
jgi:hypothetical protein